MPTYDYECDACGHAYELFQQISESPKKKCPECGRKKLRRLFGTGAAVMFKGSGFYQTDYRSDSYKKAHAADKPAGGDHSGSGDGAVKSDSSATASSSGNGKGSEKRASDGSPSKPASQ